jgi:PAS domain S-box-containing protein
MNNLIIPILILFVVIAVIVIFRLYTKLQLKNSSTTNIKTISNKFEKLIEYGSDCVIIISPEAKTMYVSPSITNILGYSVVEVMDMDIREKIHPDDIAGSENALLEAIKHPGVPMKGYTSRIKHKNGTWRWLEPVVTNFIDDPEINGIVDNFRDVTDRVIAENKLKEINERLLLATKGSKLGIWDYDFSTAKLVWDDTMHKIHGTDARFVNDTIENWLNLIHPEDRVFVQETIDKSMISGNSFDITFRITHPDATVKHIRALAQIYKDENGVPVRLIGTNIDITSNKEYELTLEQILFDISHIIRNPVAKILGISNLMDIEVIDEKSMKEFTEFMKESAEELDKCTTLLNDTYQKKKLSLAVF